MEKINIAGFDVFHKIAKERSERMNNDYYEKYLKGKHFWYFLQPAKPKNHYTYSKESCLFGGLWKYETIVGDTFNEEENRSDLFEILSNGPIGEVEFYLAEDGCYYLDVYALFVKNGRKPMSVEALRGISKAYNLLLPDFIKGETNLWVFNTFESTFKDVDHFCQFVNSVNHNTGNTVVLAEA